MNQRTQSNDAPPADHNFNDDAGGDDTFDFSQMRDLPVTIDDLSGDSSVVSTSRDSEPKAPEGEQLDIVGDKPQTPDAVVPEAKPVVPPAPETPPVAAPAPAQTAQQQPAHVVDFIEDVSRNRGRYVGELSKSFKLPDAELAMLDSDPAQFFARFRSQVYLDGLLAQSHIMREALPKIIEAHTTTRSTEKENEDKFFSINSDLKKPEYEQYIIMAAEGIRKIDPNLKGEELMKKVGSATRAMLGLPPQAQAPVAKPKGFQPASGRAPAPATPNGRMPQERNQIADIFANMQMDVD